MTMYINRNRYSRSTYNPVGARVSFECSPGMVTFTGDGIMVICNRSEGIHLLLFCSNTIL